MGWFDEQIEDRKRQERKLLADSYERLHLTVTGRKSGDSFLEGEDVNDALETLLKYFGIRERTIPRRLKGLEEKLDYLLSASDIMYRKVTLEPGWHVDAMGVMIYGMFIAVIVPAAKKERPVLTVVLLAVLISCIIHFVPAFDFITDGFAIIICAVVASLIGAVLFPVRKEDDYAA